MLTLTLFALCALLSPALALRPAKVKAAGSRPTK